MPSLPSSVSVAPAVQEVVTVKLDSELQARTWDVWMFVADQFGTVQSRSKLASHPSYLPDAVVAQNSASVAKSKPRRVSDREPVLLRNAFGHRRTWMLLLSCGRCPLNTADLLKRLQHLEG